MEAFAHDGCDGALREAIRFTLRTILGASDCGGAPVDVAVLLNVWLTSRSQALGRARGEDVKVWTWRRSLNRQCSMEEPTGEAFRFMRRRRHFGDGRFMKHHRRRVIGVSRQSIEQHFLDDASTEMVEHAELVSTSARIGKGMDCNGKTSGTSGLMQMRRMFR